MIILDTDHVSALRYADSPRCTALTARLNASGDPQIATTVITLEEQLRGWLAEIRRRPKVHDQIVLYESLLEMFTFFQRWEKTPFDDRAADEFELLRKKRVRIGTQDLKIAAITLVHRALLLSANLKDFRKVPGLRVENWLS